MVVSHELPGKCVAQCKRNEYVVVLHELPGKCVVSSHTVFEKLLCGECGECWLPFFEVKEG